MRRMFTSILATLWLTCSLNAGSPRLVSDDWHKVYMSYVPDGLLTADEIARIVFYDKQSVPQAYQHEGTFHSIYYNISAAKPIEPYGNANLEFPWKTGGIDNSPNAKDFKGLI